VVKQLAARPAPPKQREKPARFGRGLDPNPTREDAMKVKSSVKAGQAIWGD
jgi:hypothetical protein